MFYVESRRINDTVIALATRESDALSLNTLSDQEGLLDLTAWRNRALLFARQQFVSIELYDRGGKKLTEVRNPGFDAIGAVLRKQYRQLPMDGRYHYEKIVINNEIFVQVFAPLRGNRPVAGYFAGTFVVDQATLKDLHNNLIRTLVTILLIILLTTLALYPIIVSLNRDVLKFSAEVLHANIEMVSALGAAIAIRDSETNIHNYRVTQYAICLGEAIELAAEDMRRLIIGAFLHDVGKIGISDNILLKPDPLTEEECTVMHTHVSLGVEIIRTSEWLSAGREIVENHHEMFNGKGYLRGLSGTAIPLNARIFSIVDVFDALSSTRPYKKAIPLAECMAILRQEAGSRFDPELVDIFEKIVTDIHARLQKMDEPAMINWLRCKASAYFLPTSFKNLRSDTFFMCK